MDVEDATDTRLHDVHIVLMADLRPHDERTRRCWCQPRIEKIGRRAMVVHNSMDGRELVERHGVN